MSGEGPSPYSGRRFSFESGLSDIKVILVGDGESRADVEAAIKEYAVEDHVILHGWGSNSEVQDFIKSSRALVLPSYSEGLPIVLMEALALSRAVITTTIAGIPELVTASCGWLIEPGDENALAEAFRSALSADPKTLQAMGETGRQRVIAMHDISALAETLAAKIEPSLRRARASLRPCSNSGVTRKLINPELTRLNLYVLILGKY